MATIPS